VLNLWQRMHSGRLKVFASLSEYLDERRFTAVAKEIRLRESTTICKTPPGVSSMALADYAPGRRIVRYWRHLATVGNSAG
jgi:hypothetical protein